MQEPPVISFTIVSYYIIHAHDTYTQLKNCIFELNKWTASDIKTYIL